MVRKTMTTGRIALLWIVLAAAWPILNLNYPFEEVSRYVSAPARKDLVALNGEAKYVRVNLVSTSCPLDEVGL